MWSGDGGQGIQGQAVNAGLVESGEVTVWRGEERTYWHVQILDCRM